MPDISVEESYQEFDLARNLPDTEHLTDEKIEIIAMLGDRLKDAVDAEIRALKLKQKQSYEKADSETTSDS